MYIFRNYFYKVQCFYKKNLAGEGGGVKGEEKGVLQIRVIS